MMGHKICFYGKMWIIIPKLSLLPLLIWSTADFVVCWGGLWKRIFVSLQLAEASPRFYFYEGGIGSVNFTPYLLVESSTVIYWTSPITILGVSGLFCHFYSIFDGKSC